MSRVVEGKEGREEGREKPRGLFQAQTLAEDPCVSQHSSSFVDTIFDLVTAGEDREKE
jgi:hypothetical protein